MATSTSTKTVTLGLSKILVGDIAEDGGMGTTLTQLGYTYQDSASMTSDDPEETEFNAEEEDDPVAVIRKKGKTTVAFQLMNPSLDTLKELMGGTVDSTSGKWTAPSQQPVIEKSMKIVPQQGFEFLIPRISIVAKWNGTLSKSGITLVDITGTILTPTKSGESKITVQPITA